MLNNRCIRKALSLLLAAMIITCGLPLAAMIITCGLPLNVAAGEMEPGDVVSGNFIPDSSVEWKLIINDDKGTESYYGDLPTYTLEISGSGAIPDFEEPEITGYTYYAEVWPWYEHVFEYSGRNQSRRTGYITRLIINDGITRVGKNAFWGGATSDIKELSIADSIEYIGEYAFSYMYSLKTEIILPSSLKKVDEYAFYNSYNNAGIIFRGTDTVVCDHAFDNCAANDLGQVADLTGVTSLGEGAFNGCYSLVEVKNTDAIKTVGKDAFRDCQQLEKISLPGISSIPDGLFYNCYKLKSFEINGNITEIGTIGEENDDVWYDGAFYNCWELSSIEIPKSVILLGNHSFASCSSLSSVIFESGRSETIEIGTGAFANCSITSIELPEGMTKLSAGFLAGCPIESIELPSSIRVIEDGCFSGNESLKSITLHEGLESIGERAFSYCTNLETVNFPSSLRSIGEEAFRECKSLKNLVIPSGMTEVPGYIYNNCESAETIVIPDSVISIGDRAFTGCKSVKELKLPKNLKSIGKQAFQNVNKITELTIPSSVETIDEHAFASLPLITSVVIPDKVEELSGTFSGCTSLAEVKLPTGLKKIGKDTFMMCYPLKKINLSETQVTEIGDRAFGVDSYNAFKGNQLTDIKLPETLKTIGAQAFDGCIRLESVVLPESVETIGDYAFAGINYNMKLKNITIGEKAIFLGEDIFMCCPDDLTITGKTGSLIERYAIDHNINFKSNGTTDYNPILASGSIDGTSISWEIDSKGVLTVKSSENGATIPDFEIKNLLADTPWIGNREIIKKIVVEDSIEVIGIGAFRDLESVKSVELPENLKKIRLEAFAYCKSLEEITLPEGLTALGSRAFATCYKLKSINIPGSITSWCEGRDSFDTEDGHFTQCKSLKEVTIPQQLSKIYSDMFSGCTSLEKVNMHSGITEIDNHAFEKTAIKSIDLPEGLTRIGYDAFLGCEKLVSVVLPESLNNLGDNVFTNCTGLKNIVFLNNEVKGADVYCGSPLFTGCSDELKLWVYKNSEFDNQLSDYRSRIMYIDTQGNCGSDAGYIISESKDMLVYGRGSIDTASIDLSGVKTVYISEYITSISDNSFADCKENITIYALEGSYAAAWAKQHGFKYGVEGTPEGYYLDNTQLDINVGDTVTVYIMKNGEAVDAAEMKVSWFSSDPSVASVDVSFDTQSASVKIKGNKAGDAVITGILTNGDTLEVSITVALPTPDSVEILSDDIDIRVGESCRVAVNITPEKYRALYNISVITKNGDIVLITDKIRDNGYIDLYGIKAGSEKITVNVSGKTDTVDVNVKNRSITLHDGSAIKDITVIKGEAISNLYTPVNPEGKLFAGWYTEKNGEGELVTAQTKFTDKWWELYAHYTNIPDEGTFYIRDIPEQEYTGAAITPDVLVYFGDVMLNKGKDYTVKYVNNKNAADKEDEAAPAVIITGKGNYSLQKINLNKTFSIVKKSINDSSAEINTAALVKPKNKKIQKLAPVIKVAGKTLKKDKDYSLEWPDSSEKAYIEAGTYPVVITGKGNYSGEKTVYMRIYDAIETVPVSKLKISLEYTKTNYTGEACRPEVSVKIKKNGIFTDLIKDEDYTVTYENNILPGKASVIICGKGKGYAGTVIKNFTVNGVALKSVRAKYNNNNSYTGNEIKPEMTLTYTYKENGLKKTDTLVEGKDYELVYTNNINPGNKAAITIIGRGKYTGTVKKTFKIRGYNISTDEKELFEIVSADSLSCNYSKGGARIKPVVRFDGITLTEGTNYTLSYKNNSKPSNPEDIKKPLVTVKGKGILTGSISCEYEIIKGQLEDVSVSTLDIVVPDGKEKKGNYKPSLTVTDTDNNKKLGAAKDYAVSYFRNDEKEPLTATDQVKAGDKVTVKLSPGSNGYYEGEKSVTVNVVAANNNISKIASFVLAPQNFTGHAIEFKVPAGQPSEEYWRSVFTSSFIKTAAGNTDLVYGEDFEIVPGSYAKNISAGTASVMVKGIGDYCGTKTVKFQIKKVNLAM